MNSKRLSGSTYLFPAAAWIAGILIYFRASFLSGFANVTGDFADGQLIYSIHEHWFRVLKGLESWNNLSFFHPVENVLGYSDTFLGTGLVYCVFRLLNLDPFLSVQFVLLLLASIGFWGIFTWFLKFHRFSVQTSTFVALLFIIASPMFIASRNSHLQLLSIWQFPLGILLIEMAIRCWRENSPRLWIWIFFLGTWFGLLAYSTFYAAFFFGLLISLASIAAILYFGPTGTWRSIRQFRGAIWYALPGTLVLVGFTSLFLYTYLPVRETMGGRPFQIILNHLPEPWNLLNHSTTNWLWGKLSTHLWSYGEWYAMEKELGFPPLTLSISVGTAIWVLVKRRSFQPLAWISAFVFLAGTLLIMRFGPYSLWTIPYKLIPGSEGIRAAFRFNLTLLIPALFLIATALQRVMAKRLAWGTVLVLLGVPLLLLEQIQLTSNATLSRADKLAFLQNASAPPSDASSFYAIGTPLKGWLKPHTKAIFLSQAWDLPTLNGRSGFDPPGWKLYEMDAKTAQKEIPLWSQQSGLSGKVYIYDLNSNEWLDAFILEEPAPLIIDGEDLLQVPRGFYSGNAFGWSEIEPWGVWSKGKRAGFRFDESSLPSTARYLKLEAIGFVSDKHPALEVDILFNGDLVKSLRFSTEKARDVWNFALPPTKGKSIRLEFVIDDPVSPASLGIGEDPRELGIGLISLTISSKPIQPDLQ